MECYKIHGDLNDLQVIVLNIIIILRNFEKRITSNESRRSEQNRVTEAVDLGI